MTAVALLTQEQFETFSLIGREPTALLLVPRSFVDDRPEKIDELVSSLEDLGYAVALVHHFTSEVQTVRFTRLERFIDWPLAGPDSFHEKDFGVLWVGERFIKSELSDELVERMRDESMEVFAMIQLASFERVMEFHQEEVVDISGDRRLCQTALLSEPLEFAARLMPRQFSPSVQAAPNISNLRTSGLPIFEVHHKGHLQGTVECTIASAQNEVQIRFQCHSDTAARLFEPVYGMVETLESTGSIPSEIALGLQHTYRNPYWQMGIELFCDSRLQRACKVLSQEGKRVGYIVAALMTFVTFMSGFGALLYESQHPEIVEHTLENDPYDAYVLGSPTSTFTTEEYTTSIFTVVIWALFALCFIWWITSTVRRSLRKSGSAKLIRSISIANYQQWKSGIQLSDPAKFTAVVQWEQNERIVELQRQQLAVAAVQLSEVQRLRRDLEEKNKK